jgi:hypothetical protein
VFSASARRERPFIGWSLGSLNKSLRTHRGAPAPSRVCRVGPGNFTPSRSQIAARVTARRPPSVGEAGEYCRPAKFNYFAMSTSQGFLYGVRLPISDWEASVRSSLWQATGRQQCVLLACVTRAYCAAAIARGET